MSFILSIYSKDAFKEYILPPINNSDYIIYIYGGYFGLKEDIKLKLETMDFCWRFQNDVSYTIYKDNEVYKNQVLQDKDILQIKNIYNEEISVIVKNVESCFHAFRKYCLQNIQEITIGKEDDNDISYDYLGMVSRHHSKIIKTPDGYCIDNYSQNGVYVNSKRIDEHEKLVFGEYINIMGLHMVFLGDVLAVDIDNEAVKINNKKLKQFVVDEDATLALETRKKYLTGKTLYHRAPRNYERLVQKTIEIEAPPQLNTSKERPLLLTIGPSITMALPMLLGCVMMIYASSSMGGGSSLFMYSGLVMSVSSAVIGVTWALINIRYEKKEKKEEEEYRFHAYSKYLIEKKEEVKESYEKTVKQLLDIYPDAEKCLEYNEKSATLWNRNCTHMDFLSHRLGLGDIPFQVKMEIPQKRFTLYKDSLAEKPEFIKDNYRMLCNVPVTVNLVEKNLIGIVGGLKKKGAIELVRILSAQIAANNCYTDVKLGYIYDNSNPSDYAEWEFAKWFPHVWSEDKKTRFIASNKEETSDVFYELTKVFRTRQEMQEQSPKEKIPKPYYIIFVSNIKALEGELFSKYIFEQSKVNGLTTVLLSESYEELPNNCDFIIENSEDFQGMYSVTDTDDEKQKIKFDNVNKDELEAFSRHLSSLRVQEVEEGGEIPNSLTFFEMLGVNRPEELQVRELWAKNRVYENIRGQIGEKAGGVPCFLDVHEKYHGPHGLVAGTTGSGKSETLQTYMLSLAVNYSPDDIGFFVIDYKGGGMANLFEGLPHMVGQISNLSGNQVKRAMISIKSENRRRQRLFTEHGVNNINLYTKLYKNGEASSPIPHLFIIIDEFAELKKEEPDFMRELISVAQVGRSLGVHLILATQKPSGTVDDNIWSNSKFRLCLRVQDQQDSKDMLHKSDAAYITQAGRCYLQVGNDEIYELFQSGYSGAIYDETAIGENVEIAKLVSMTGKIEMTGNSLKNAKKKKEKQKAKHKEKTQLDAVKEYLASVAQNNGYTYKHQLWMPVLPDHIYLKEFPEYRNNSFENNGWETTNATWDLRIILGKMDDPENQAQMPLVVDFAKDGHIAILGSIVSGKSTMMQTMAFALIQRYTPDVINIYALDFSSKMMSAFERAPQFGGIMYENDLDKISKFFNMMEDILKERKKLFRGGNYKQYVQVHGIVFPSIIIFIDNYASFKEKTEEVYEEQIIRLSKEGLSYGIFLVISGKGFGISDITNRIGENLETVLCLTMQDKYAYADYLHSMQIEVLPESGIKGRGLAYYGKRILEYQTALALEAENDYQRLEMIQQICEKMDEKWNGKHARKIPEIPEKPTWSEFVQLDEFKSLANTKCYLPVGYNSANASVFGVSLKEVYCYLIYGSERTGKTNFLKVCIQAAMEMESEIYIIDGPDKVLSSYAEQGRITYANDEESIFELFQKLTPIIKERNALKRELISCDKDEEEIFDEISKTTPHFIFISDLSWFVKLIYETEINMKGFLENIISKGSLHNIYFFAEISLNARMEITGYPVYELMAAYKKGIHFGGKVVDNPVLDFDYIPYMEQSKSEKVGIGMIPDATNESDAKKIVIPLARR